MKPMGMHALECVLYPMLKCGVLEYSHSTSRLTR